MLCLLLRFELVYYGLYKCNRTRLQDFEHLPQYLRDLAHSADIEDTIDREAIKRHHYADEPLINPKGLVPRGRGLDLRLPHDRAVRFAAVELESLGTEEAASASRRKGEWVRPRSAHRDVISTDGSTPFPAEAGRYHLYIANNCPWCHRVALARSMLGLDEVISMDVLFYRRDPERGWQFRPSEPGCTPDTIHGYTFIRQLYEKLGSTEKSVPVLYDRVTGSIVNNESAQIVRMLGQAFAPLGHGGLDLYPVEHRDEIDRINAWVYTEINNGAYKAGFASTQAAYAMAYDRLFAAFDALDERLAVRPFLVGPAPTEADLRLYPTLFRFDHVYYTRFRLDHKMVRDYPHLQRWLEAMSAWPGVAPASNLEHCKRGYFGRTGNNIVPLGPALTNADGGDAT
ncbi:MAG: glutathione S-transferase C-terminal domain-containing protein [Deltaproteobacteria bacterium]|nr:glutathione S-transferase C-terminal domain-containing protein [Deltaproteobacteria bacterium]